MSDIDSIKEYAQTATVTDTMMSNTSKYIFKDKKKKKKDIDNFTSEDYIDAVGDNAKYIYYKEYMSGHNFVKEKLTKEDYIDAYNDPYLGSDLTGGGYNLSKEVDENAFQEWKDNQKIASELNSLQYYESMTKALDNYSTYEQSFFSDNFSQLLSEAMEKNNNNTEKAVASCAEKLPNVFK